MDSQYLVRWVLEILGSIISHITKGLPILNTLHPLNDGIVLTDQIPAKAFLGVVLLGWQIQL